MPNVKIVKNDKIGNSITATKNVLSTGELANLCRMTKHTVISAIEKGELRASKTPGGHHRIRREDAETFMRRYDLLPAESVTRTNNTVLLVDEEAFVRDILAEVVDGRGVDIIHATTIYEAGWMIEREKPEVIMLNANLLSADISMVCEHVRSVAYGKKCRILAVMTAEEVGALDSTREAQVDEVIGKPFRVDELRQKIHALLPTNAHEN